MKKIGLILMLMALLVLVTGCVNYPTVQKPQIVQESKDSPDTSEDNSTNENTLPSEDTFSIGDTIKLNDWNITVNSVSFEKTISESTFLKRTADEGNVYIVLDIKIKNVGTKEQTFFPWISLSTCDAKVIFDNTYEFSSFETLFEKDLHGKTVNPLSEYSGFLAFEAAQEVESSDKPLVIKIIDNNSEMKVKLR